MFARDKRLVYACDRKSAHGRGIAEIITKRYQVVDRFRVGWLKRIFCFTRGKSNKTRKCRGVTYPDSYTTKYSTFTKNLITVQKAGMGSIGLRESVRSKQKRPPRASERKRKREREEERDIAGASVRLRVRVRARVRVRVRVRVRARASVRVRGHRA